jgi:hypothetical protein
VYPSSDERCDRLSVAKIGESEHRDGLNGASGGRNPTHESESDGAV